MATSEAKIFHHINIRNKKAAFEYEFIEKFTAGMVLQGTEIKSIRNGKVNFQDTYCHFTQDGIIARGLHISPYEKGTHFNHDPKRDRKLLLSRKEIRRLRIKSEEKGLTIIPTRLYINERGFAKLEIALARGKKTYDKRESIREKDLKRDLERNKHR